MFSFSSLFTLDKNQCRGVDLQQQQQQISRDPYDEQSGILLKGDNLARMLALRSGANMLNVERLADDMLMYGLVRFGKILSSLIYIFYFLFFFSPDECDQQTECSCSRKFHNDDHHQYILSKTHRLIPKQRLDLIALMQNDINETNQSLLISSPISIEHIRTSSSNSSVLGDESSRRISNSDEIDCTTKLTCSIDGFRRKKSASLNSPANSGKRNFNYNYLDFCF
jgi:hypothetical protein